MMSNCQSVKNVNNNGYFNNQPNVNWPTGNVPNLLMYTIFAWTCFRFEPKCTFWCRIHRLFLMIVKNGQPPKC